MTKFEKLKNEILEANEAIHENVIDEDDVALANDAANLLISVMLKALWGFRSTSEFTKLDDVEKDVIYEMIKYYELALNCEVEEEA